MPVTETAGKADQRSVTEISPDRIVDLRPKLKLCEPERLLVNKGFCGIEGASRLQSGSR